MPLLRASMCSMPACRARSYSAAGVRSVMNSTQLPCAYARARHRHNPERAGDGPDTDDKGFARVDRAPRFGLQLPHEHMAGAAGGHGQGARLEHPQAPKQLVEAGVVHGGKFRRETKGNSRGQGPRALKAGLSPPCAGDLLG